jgi:hypothetical protein
MEMIAYVRGAVGPHICVWVQTQLHVQHTVASTAHPPQIIVY